MKLPSVQLAAIAFAFAIATVSSTAHAAAKVEITFLPPARYTDVGDSLRQQDDNLKEIGAYVQKLGETSLADQQTLSVVFLDIDLAGRPKLFHRGAGDYRIMSGGADWPHMRLHWTLQTPGQPARGGDADLADMNYMFGIRPFRADEPLFYDKRMVARWFGKTFGTGQPRPDAVTFAP